MRSFFIAFFFAVCYNTAMNENISENISKGAPDAARSYILVCVDNAVVFPGHMSSFVITGTTAVNALMAAVQSDDDVFFSYAPDGETPSSVSAVGTLSKIRQVVRNSKGGISIVVSGIRRME